MPADRFYKMLEDDPSLVPKTTQVPMGELLEFLRVCMPKDTTNSSVTTISVHLSGSINGILAAAAELEVKMQIVAYDTKTVCFNEGVFALEACRMQEVSATFEDVIERHRLVANNLGIFSMEHLDFLLKWPVFQCQRLCGQPSEH